MADSGAHPCVRMAWRMGGAAFAVLVHGRGGADAHWLQ